MSKRKRKKPTQITTVKFAIHEKLSRDQKKAIKDLISQNEKVIDFEIHDPWDKYNYFLILAGILLFIAILLEGVIR